MDLITLAVANKFAKAYTDSQIENADFSSMSYYCCSSGEYNSSTGVPTISSPDANTFYITPAINSNGVYNMYIYKNNQWVLFYTCDVDLTEFNNEITSIKQDLSEIETDVQAVQYGLENLTPYDETKVTVQYATLETPEYTHGYTIKATGYGSATPRVSYTLAEAPDIASTDIMYLSFEIYVDAEASEYTANLYQPKCFGHAFSDMSASAKQWTKVQRRYSQGNGTVTAVGFNTGISFSSTSVAKNKVVHLRNMVCVNLTKTYGSGKEPTLEQMNAIVTESGDYFEKYNLFDAKQVTIDVDGLKEFAEHTTANSMVNFVNYFITSKPNAKNDGSEYSLNGNGTQVSVDAFVPAGSSGSYVAGDIIYCFGEFRVQSDNDDCASLSPSQNTKGEKTSIENPTNGTWYPVSARTGNHRGTQFVGTWENNASIKIYYKHVVVINLTSVFGKYCEPTKEALDQYFYSVSQANAIDFVAENAKMFILSMPSRALRHPIGTYVRLDEENNVKMGSVPDPNWAGWQEIGTYGQFNVSAIPVYNKVHGTIETDGMVSVLPIWGCWSEAASSGNTHHGGHVFHGWTTDRQHRLTMVQNIYSDNEAAIFNYIPGDKSETSEGVFLPLRMGADNVYKGVLIEPIYNPENLASYRMTRETVYGRLNISKPQNYNHIPASADADGVKGDICFDANYVYFCVADNTWKRVALSAWT